MGHSNIVIHPKQDEDTWLNRRRGNINSREVSALFGMSRCATTFALWNVKAGRFVSPEIGGDRVAAGQFLEVDMASCTAHKIGADAVRSPMSLLYDDLKEPRSR